MINLHASINQYFFGNDYFINLYNFERMISKHKGVDVNLTFYPHTIFEMDLDTRYKGRDHAGVHFNIGLLGLSFSLKIYDIRHWDNETNDWEIYLKQLP